MRCDTQVSTAFAERRMYPYGFGGALEKFGGPTQRVAWQSSEVSADASEECPQELESTALMTRFRKDVLIRSRSHSPGGRAPVSAATKPICNPGCPRLERWRCPVTISSAWYCAAQPIDRATHESRCPCGDQRRDGR